MGYRHALVFTTYRYYSRGYDLREGCVRWSRPLLNTNISRKHALKEASSYTKSTPYNKKNLSYTEYIYMRVNACLRVAQEILYLARYVQSASCNVQGRYFILLITCLAFLGPTSLLAQASLALRRGRGISNTNDATLDSLDPKQEIRVLPSLNS